jgi:hypothetical protein
MTDTMTSKNIDVSSWDILYIIYRQRRETRHKLKCAKCPSHLSLVIFGAD